MRVLLSTYGSRGDVEPIAGLAVQLKALGAAVRVCAPPDEEFAALLARAGVPLSPAFAPVRQWASAALKNRAAVDLPRTAATVLEGQVGAIAAAAEDCDAIVAAGLFPSAAAARSVAERWGIRYVFATFCPSYLPSPQHRPHEYPGHAHPAGETDNRVLWARDVATKNALFGVAYNAHRVSVGLPPVADVRDHVFTRRPWLAADPTIGPWRPSDLCDGIQTGAWILPDERPLPHELLAFLESGPPPVYVGFGSMPMPALNDAADLAVAAIRAQGLRAVVARGWAGLAPVALGDDGIVVGDVNQQALFGRVAAVVHHGGAGTTATAARAGAPQLVVPQIADQPYWAGRVAALGIGAALPGPAPTFDSFSAAMATALAPATRAAAATVAGTVRGDGAAAAAKLLFGRS